ncbi:MAG: phosphoadenylyl-sulfate reductase [Bernardetiaceae bacterium]|jgi:phosphoadenosine phosphosulfate reductase|nr:phosphoadenylyl-sulfate reductase [Bernardetiaceae bacterium]
MTIDQLTQSLAPLTLEESLQWLAQQFGPATVFSTSFGQEDQVIYDAIARQQLPIRVFTLDTGRLFPETYELMDRTRSRYPQQTFATFFPQTERVQNLVDAKGFHSFYDSVDNRKECCGIRKLEPLRRALAGATVWITGLRAEQSDARADLPQVEWDAAHQVFKFHPLLGWSYAQVTDYLQAHRVPDNPLHRRGFVSIGCQPCTRAIEPGEHPRAGRWWWEQSKKECGLHG